MNFLIRLIGFVLLFTASFITTNSITVFILRVLGVFLILFDYDTFVKNISNKEEKEYTDDNVYEYINKTEQLDKNEILLIRDLVKLPNKDLLKILELNTRMLNNVVNFAGFRKDDYSIPKEEREIYAKLYDKIQNLFKNLESEFNEYLNEEYSDKDYKNK